MSNLPPHLPPPSSNLADHRKWQRIKVLFVSVIFGLLAGVSGASMLLGWVWPGFGGGEVFFMSKNIITPTPTVLDPQIRIELEDRIASVYSDVSDSAGLSFLSLDKKIGQAVFVSSDGWLVLHRPAVSSDNKKWRVLLDDGHIYVVQKAIIDNHANLVYIKINPEQSGVQFKVVNFFDDVNLSDDVYVYNNQSWHHTKIVNKLVRSLDLPHLDTAPNTAVELAGVFDQGDLVSNAQGKIIGLVSEERYVLPSKYILNILPGILGAQKVAYHTLGVVGWYSAEQPIVVKNEKMVGFAVAKVLSEDSQLKAGDFILEINGHIADNENLWYNINNNQILKLKVLRKGKIIEFTQNILEN